MRAVNLLPKDDLAANSIRNEDPAVVIGSALGLVVLIALAGAFYMSHSQAAAQQQKLNTARLELGKLSLIKKPVVKIPKRTRPIIPIPAVTGEESARLTAVSSAMSTRIAWDRILREFALVIPGRRHRHRAEHDRAVERAGPAWYSAFGHARVQP
jgi:hypothetical protein